MASVTTQLRQWLRPLRHTPFHPQWFSFRGKKNAWQQASKKVRGRLLDIGCADGSLRNYLSPDCEYVGLDYFDTAKLMYHTRPNIFGDAEMLPFRAAVFDAVTIFDVMEHLPDPQACMDEIGRVLKPGGDVLIHVPFLYPLHDQPFDYWRFTEHGMREIALKSGLRVHAIDAEGAPVETAALLVNLAMTSAVLRSSRHFPPAILLIAVVAPCVFVLNCFGWLIGRMTSSDSFMPVSYWLVLAKESKINSGPNS